MSDSRGDLESFLGYQAKRAGKALEDALKRRFQSSIGEIDKMSNIVGDYVRFSDDLARGVIYSPYESLSDKREGYIELGGPLKSRSVEYRGPYATLGAAVKDFMVQTNLTQYELAVRSHVSTRSIVRVIHDELEMPKTRRQENGQKESVERIISYFDIHPPEKLAEVRALIPYQKVD